MRKIIIASTSTLPGQNYLEYLLPVLKRHFKDCNTILFIPYARPSGITHEEYTKIAASAFAKINFNIQGIHEFDNPVEGIQNAEGIFVGGGNTFLLVTQLYTHKIMSLLSATIKNGTPYLGSSAGGNICGLSMQTTNDMPIIYPPSFKTLGLVPFNINPHYLDADSTSKHMGESRETRINEFHQLNNIPVLGLREGSWIEIRGTKITLKGGLSVCLFKKGKDPMELDNETDLSELK